MIDHNGYPTEAFLDELRSLQDSDKLLARAAEAINATGYGSAREEGGMLHIATGGWSGCEDIVEAVLGNIFGTLRWESSHRGGLHVFRMGGSDAR